MKILSWFLILFPLLNSCTLSKEESEIIASPDKIVINLDYTITGDKSNDDYTLIILRDTVDMYHQTPLFYGVTRQFSISRDSLPKGFWILLKKWTYFNSVFESKPVYISFDTPEKSNIKTIIIDNPIVVKERKLIFELLKVNFYVHKLRSYHNETLTYFHWDADTLDDNVSDSLPDIYFNLGEIFQSGKTEFVDHPYGLFTRNFNRFLIPSDTKTLSLSCYDYDFGTSADDLLFSITMDLTWLAIKDFENGISRNISLNGSYNDYFEGYPYYLPVSLKIY
jgi:hypothetical protein